VAKAASGGDVERLFRDAPGTIGAVDVRVNDAGVLPLAYVA
jgi:hypothetical protein